MTQIWIWIETDTLTGIREISEGYFTKAKYALENFLEINEPLEWNSESGFKYRENTLVNKIYDRQVEARLLAEIATKHSEDLNTIY